jgi:exopolysaccharide production negative regulator
MRTSEILLSMGLLALAFGLSPAVSFDGRPEGSTTVVPMPNAAGSVTPEMNTLGSATPLVAVPVNPLVTPRSMVPSTPFEAFRSGTQALRQGRTDQAVLELEYAAEQGVPGALWKLGRMYSDGDGVPMNESRAYDYFRRLTALFANENVDGSNAGYLAKAFVALGQYHLNGIPGTLQRDANVAREMFRYAATYYADPEAQYLLGKHYLLEKPKDSIQAARWLRLAANKGEHRAQALLGGMLFRGEEVSRQAALGLFWLIVAKDGAAPEETWITEMYADAIAQANENDRTLAHKYLEDWLKRRILLPPGHTPN